ncbi:MAG: DUF3341 domain-containing protein [Candidatus Krumholzibacteria bacterium]|jgi:hypothetical protein|nr:DUF3341 domain-containing protein [Candidatus Krumholzibacteria bacterium]MDP6668604.1 DUF3341 domain-containing protein [Candidatus Krumholzibacteria bacterium]MDP6796325.1 DUF3341 domain-containing protein [Candidatus Krumholzibacteria bacterium]MDP7021328.1 DUF3341 domain-containing protein [Candidatus Krumholzibacteria bacterium]
MSQEKLFGYLVEFETAGDLMKAAEKVRVAGFRKWDCHTPFPVHGLDDAMGLDETRLPWIVLLSGASGAFLGMLMQWWMNAVDYPLNISGKPLWSIPANIPVGFETTVLMAAFGAFFGMLALNGLPRLHHPVFGSERFRRATDDRFFISLESRDPSFDEKRTLEFAKTLSSLPVERLED